MSEVTITDPELHAEKTVDGQGRVYLGTDHAGDRVRVTVEQVREADDE